MCGIFGFSGFDEPDLLRRMADVLRHRGPDAEGSFHHGRFSMGMRRLSIIDLEGGDQPIYNEDRSLAICFNGEIYNYVELREELESLGHRFATRSDTEVIVHAWEQWGEESLARLNGMFAFALYDRRSGRILLARDRFGEKPMFWRRTHDGLSFASELPALARQRAAPALELDPAGLQKFFAYGLFPGASTPYRGVQKLPAGHSLSYDLASGRIDLGPYWTFRIEPRPEPVTPARERQWIEELRDLLSQAVLHRLESDVPLGIFLSGGIDSSTVLAFAARHQPAAEIRTFTIGFFEKSFDESAWAGRMAAAIGSQHAAETCEQESARALVPNLLESIGEPIGDSSILPTYLLCRFARRHVTVALSGDGGDELFAGYDPFRALAAAAAYRRLMPPSLHPLVRRVASLLPRSDRNMSFDFALRRGLRGAGYRPALWNPIWLAPLDPEEVGELFRTRIDPEELYSEATAIWDGCASPHPVDRSLEFYTRIYLQDGILAKTDRASMQVSLESRAPLLDNDLVDFVRRLPHAMKFRRGQSKYILKRAMHGLLPEAILARRKKGFGIPLSRWVGEIEPPPPDRPLPLDTGWLARRWQAHAAGRDDLRQGLWCWLSLDRAVRGARLELPRAGQAMAG
jgi:asparagine synthase (glutamine-hydrolysing)